MANRDNSDLTGQALFEEFLTRRCEILGPYQYAACEIRRLSKNTA